MNWSDWLLWGFVSTIVLTTIEAGSQSMGLTRMSIPFILGTIFTPDRDKAKWIGFGVHVLNGWLFSLSYVLIFHSLGEARWWLGSIVGLGQALFVLTVGMWILPGMHPRMATEQHGPTVTRELEPPGFLGLNYGIQTPITVVVAHLIFGAIIGAFYKMPPSAFH